MGASTLTSEQHEAVSTRSTSVALSAGAGCGKTHVLTQRFLSHLAPKVTADDREPARLPQLVAITFTDAAAREMRSRIRNECYRRLDDTSLPGDVRDVWLRLLRQLETARISTIHAFCTSLLRQHALAVGLDPAFGVLNQGDADVLQNDAIDDVLRAQLAAHDEATLDLAAAYGLSRLKQQIAVMLDATRMADFATWLERSTAEVVTIWRDHYAREAWPNAIREIAAEAPIDLMLLLLTESGLDCSKKPAFADARAVLIELLPRLSDSDCDEKQLQRIVDVARVQRICSAKDWPSPEAFDSYKNACKQLREDIERLVPRPFDKAAALLTARLGLELLRLTRAVAEAYSHRKFAAGKLDFDDLLARAHALVTAPANEPLRKQLSREVALVLVDEFQDTDELQAELIKTLCGEDFAAGKLFFVGDFKQSIYRFRGAQPRVFHDLRNEIDEAGRLSLTVNFRSQPAILQFVNALFCETFGKEYEPLAAKREQQSAEPSVEFLWTLTPDKKSHAKGMAEAARKAEAHRIAGRLRALIDNAQNECPIVDEVTKKPRGVKPGDIAILFRALSDVQLYEEALRAHDLEYYLVGGHAFYAQQEIFDVLNLLRALASPADEISLAGILRSPFFSLEDETLFWLVEAGSKEMSAGTGFGKLNAGLFAKPPKELANSEREKVLRAAKTIGFLRSIKDRVPIAELLGKALSLTGYDAVLLVEFLGQRKLANLHKLIEQARAADHGGNLDLDGFITQLSQFIVQQPKEALAATAAETADVIRLMTIHQAKGLEFPLVVVPDLDRPPQVRTPPAAFDQKLGPLVSYPNDDEKEPATGMSLYAARERVDELDERKRLLYVACTRAADHLILSSSVVSCEEPASDWMKLIGERFKLSTGELEKPLPAGYQAPQVRVSAEAVGSEPQGVKTRGPDIIAMLNAAHELAEDGPQVELSHVGPIPIDRAARRQFSFSRLTGKLVRVAAPPVVAEADGAETIFGPDFDPREVEVDLGIDVDGVGDITDLLPSKKAARLDPRSVGNLVHDVIARTDFRDDKSSALIRSWCEHLAVSHVDQREGEAAAEAAEMIERLVKSPRGRTIAGAAEFHRELEFLLPWPAADKKRGAKDVAPAGSPLLIRGYIDCLYLDADGGWHLVDYKTNLVAAANCQHAARQYELQLYVYALAVEQALGVAPVELVLHFLRPGVEHAFEWNDAARLRAIKLINEAIGEATAT